MTPRVVLDTNIVVSGVGWGGKPGDVVEGALLGRFEMVTSQALLKELEAVLKYPRLAAAIPESSEPSWTSRLMARFDRKDS